MWASSAINLLSAIEETLGYFGLQSLPLSAFDVWRMISRSARYQEVWQELARGVDRGSIIQEGGWYTLPETRGAFDERRERLTTSLAKLRRARRVSAYLKCLPYIRAVFLCNSLGVLNATANADIDFFIVVRAGSIWRARFFSALPFMLLGLRPGTDSIRDRFCFSFFLSDEALDLRPLALAQSDPYLAFWALTLLPLHDPEALYQKLFIQSGLEKQFPQIIFPETSRLEPRRPFGPSFLEQRLEKIQRAYFPPAIRSALIRTGTEVVANQQVLKFHTLDRRLEIRERFQTLLTEHWAKFGLL